LRIMPALDKSLASSPQQVHVAAGSLFDTRRRRQIVTDLAAAHKDTLLPKVSSSGQKETLSLK
jgi:hypothetical protein